MKQVLRGMRALPHPVSWLLVAVALGLALGVWCRRATKQNSLPRVVGVSLLALVALALAWACNLAEPDTSRLLANPLEAWPWLCCHLVVMSLASFAAFGVDKRRATRGEHRVPEKALLSLCLVGGTPGGILGMLAFRHKVRTPAFAFGLWLLLLTQTAWLVWLVAGGLA